MLKLAGGALIAAGVAGFWFGGIPYTSRDTILQLGSLKAEADFKHKLAIPPEASLISVGLGTVLLLIPRGRKRSGNTCADAPRQLIFRHRSARG